jgi:7-cyano-7-deazaguanine synthase in queuosine biosynthesis
MAHDHLDIHLALDIDPAPNRYPRRAHPPPVDAVALLSGGLDSACAAVDILRRYERPCFVSYGASPHVRRAQKNIISALNANREQPIRTATFNMHLEHQHPEVPLPESELSQRSRTLLFAGVAATVAAARGMDTVTLGENGVMAINCPLTTGRVGGFSTHTAHPDVLALMVNLFSQVLGNPVRVDNPLLYKTKTEVVSSLSARGLSDLIPKTHSCWIARQAKHCGVCVPCVVRRFAVDAAGVQDAVYQHDSFEDPSPRDDRKFNAIGDYLLFARTFDELSNDDFASPLPYLFEKVIIKRVNSWRHD